MQHERDSTAERKLPTSWASRLSSNWPKTQTYNDVTFILAWTNGRAHMVSNWIGGVSLNKNLWRTLSCYNLSNGKEWLNSNQRSMGSPSSLAIHALQKKLSVFRIGRWQNITHAQEPRLWWSQSTRQKLLWAQTQHHNIPHPSAHHLWAHLLVLSKYNEYLMLSRHLVCLQHSGCVLFGCPGQLLMMAALTSAMCWYNKTLYRIVCFILSCSLTQSIRMFASPIPCAEEITWKNGSCVSQQTKNFTSSRPFAFLWALPPSGAPPHAPAMAASQSSSRNWSITNAWVDEHHPEIVEMMAPYINNLGINVYVGKILDAAGIRLDNLPVLICIKRWHPCTSLLECCVWAMQIWRRVQIQEINRKGRLNWQLH